MPAWILVLLSSLAFVSLSACDASPRVNSQQIMPGTDTPSQTTERRTREVLTLNGPLVGVFDTDDVQVFRGIPYAQPPVKELRWRPPQAARPWSGTFTADQFSASCIQQRFTSNYVWRRNDFSTSEDCLYLNIWALNEAQDLPVMVWFHGGAHTSGQGHSEIFNGTELAQRGVVLVSINYRLGALGYLAHPWLAEESHHASSGNYGLLDKIAALNWIRDNIAQFGGNPDNVTIFGQSAGSQSVCSLMVSPLAEGLFHKAIGQSAACIGPPPQRDPAGLERGEKLVQEVGAESLDALRQADPQAILDATERSGWENQSRITIDGWVITEPHLATFQAGKQANVPLMVGCLADEGVNLIPVNDQLGHAEFNKYLARTFGDLGIRIGAAYAEELAQSPGIAQHAITTDLFMAFAMRRWAEYQTPLNPNTYLYFMDHVPPAFHLYMPDDPVLNLPEGPRHAAYHSGDLAYVFGTVDRVGVDWNDQDRALTDHMMTYWTNFARTGDPNGEGLPNWPKFSRSSMSTQVLNIKPSTVNGVRREKIDLFAEAMPL